MSVVPWQIPRASLAWLLLAQAALLLPQVEHLPYWISGVFVFTAFWRVMVFQGRWSLPHAAIKGLMALACIVGIYTSYRTFVGLEPTVGLVIAGFYLKLLEMSTRRDAYVIIFLGFFIALTQFLFSQYILITLYMLLPLVLLLAALVALHQSDLLVSQTISIKKAGMIFLHALPIMLLLFIVFPRIGPMWGVPSPQHQAKTGMTDELSPGDVSALAQDSRLALRVLFDGGMPSLSQMYWRGTVMSAFDGRRWRVVGQQARLLTPSERSQIAQRVSGHLRYNVIQEPTRRPFVFGLAVASVPDSRFLMTSDYQLRSINDLTDRAQYTVESNLTLPRDALLLQEQRDLNMQLPAQGNQRTRVFARDLRAAVASDADFVDAVLQFYRREPFVYTLKPPPLGADTIDQFLFKTRRGFCEHYASSFTFIMRAAGVPARIVAGYQGGEVNPLTGAVLVHQFDAHAWSEVWLTGRGWVRVDPTAAVAPARIERGLEDALAAEGSFLSDSPLSALRFRHVAWLNGLRLQLDALNYEWARWVLGYRGETQMDVLRTVLGKVDILRMMMLVLGVGAAVIGVIAAGFFFAGYQRPDPARRAYDRLCTRLNKIGYGRQPAEGPIDYARRLSREKPAWKTYIQAVTRAYVAVEYENVSRARYRAELTVLRRECARFVDQIR